MNRTWMDISAFLASLPVDTASERDMLAAVAGNTGMDTILVAGSPEAAPLTLIPTPAPLFDEEDIPGFPVIVEYGAEFSVCVTNREGETERYRDAGDFRHFCAHRFSELSECRVAAPAELLHRAKLVFVCLNGDDQSMEAAGRGCSGCVLVLRADAGCLSDKETALCGHLASVWCIAGRTAMLLRWHGPFGNELLPMMAEQLLGRGKLAAFSCGTGKEALLSEQRGLESAVLDILDRDPGNIPEGILRGCLIRVREKLCLASEAALEQENQRQDMTQRYRQAAETFRAMCLTEKYSLGSLLTQEDMEHLRKEVHDLFAVLRDRFPQMVEEVVDTLPTAKEDLKNLAGDYLGALTDGFLDTLLEQITNDLLVPRTRERFLSVCQRFRRLMQEQGLEAAEMEAQAEAEFLRVSEVNMGDFHTGISQVIAGAAGTAVRLALRWAMMKLELFGFYELLDQAEVLTQQVVMDWTDRIMPARIYARSLSKHSAQYLEEAEARIYRSLEETVFPRLIHILQEEFEKLTGAYSKQFDERIAAAEEAYRIARDARQSLETHLDALCTQFLNDEKGGCGQ